MLTIGICDDKQEQLDILKDFIDRDPMVAVDQVVVSTDPLHFLEGMTDLLPDILFLDVDMPRMNGIELGKKIRSQHKDVVIVYISAHEDYALEAFGVRAFHYLLKPISEDGFHKVLGDALDQVERLKSGVSQKSFVVKTKKETISLKINDIHYFEKTGHRIRISSSLGDYYYYDNFINLMKKVEATDFIRCHQGYVVNIRQIRSYKNKTLFLLGGETLPVSRSYVGQVRHVIAERLFGWERH